MPFKLLEYNSLVHFLTLSLLLVEKQNLPLTVKVIKTNYETNEQCLQDLLHH